MTSTRRRLRIFAGPNGSGKTSLVRELAKEFSPSGQFHLHQWINADEIEVALRTGKFDFGPFWGTSEPQSLLDGLAAARLVGGQHPFVLQSRLSGTSILCDPVTVDSYVAATVADLLRTNLLCQGESLSYETVMSHPSKIEFLHRAHAAGYQIYLYFVATQSVDINLSRIENRVQLGQHAVPADKVRERYVRSINLLPEAFKLAHRAFLFDNTGDNSVWFAEKTPEGEVKIRVPNNELPAWYLNIMEQ